MLTLSFLIATQAGAVTLMPFGNGGRSFVRLGGSPLTLSSTAPKSVKKTPTGELIFATVRLAGNAYTVAVDRTQPGRAFFDKNRDGDLTNDPPVRASGILEGPLRERRSYLYEAQLPPDKIFKDPTIAFELRDAGSPQEAFLWGPNYVFTGILTIDDRQHWTVVQPQPTPEGLKEYLYIDRNADNLFDPSFERFPLNQPFVVRGKAFRLTAVDRAKGKFLLSEVAEKVNEIAVPELGKYLPNGEAAPSFNAVTIDGQPVAFPADFKGKAVLLDFFASWYVYHLEGMPKLAALVDKHKAQNLAVLSVSLDEPDMAGEVRRVQPADKYPWPLIYEGKGRQSELAKTYRHFNFPMRYLVDGDTGRILAGPEELTNPKIGATLEKLFSKEVSR